MEVPWRREPLKVEGMEGWGVAQRMGALEGEGSWNLRSQHSVSVRLGGEDSVS